MITKIGIITLFFGIFGGVIWLAMSGLNTGLNTGFSGLGYLDASSVVLIIMLICAVIVAFAIDIFF